MDKEQILYIGSTIKRLRAEQKLSQEDLAGLTGYSREYISKVEQNHMTPASVLVQHQSPKHLG